MNEKYTVHELGKTSDIDRYTVSNKNTGIHKEFSIDSYIKNYDDEKNIQIKHAILDIELYEKEHGMKK
jgi:hypothetical protein